jgi:dihydrofolate reductase
VRASVFIATSLDGFIARNDDALDWLPGADSGGSSPSPPPDTGYNEFIASVDVIVLGRNTYEKVLTMDGWFYGQMPVRVLTTRPLEVRESLRKTVAAMSGAPRDILETLSREGFKHAYVDGGKTIQAYLRDGLIQRITLTRVPVLIGDGIPLFGSLPHDVQLRHLRTRVLGDAMVQSEYEILS